LSCLNSSLTTSTEVNFTKDSILDLSQYLKNKIFGQEEIVDEVVGTIMISAAGIHNKEKPIGSFLFAGPTGTGKTELAKELAKKLKMEFIRFDMSEYSDEYSARNLTGGQAGLVGYEKGGLLTNAILENPASVILFDEIEKADPAVYKVFLQILDYATLTDTKGNKVDFSNTIIIMTSNLGVQHTTIQANMGFIQANKTQEKSVDFSAIVDFFTPEMRARIDKMLFFNPITDDIILQIIDKFLEELKNELKQKHIKLYVEEPAKKLLKELWNNSEKEGARTISKIINTQFKQMIAIEMLYGFLQDGGELRISAHKKKFLFEEEQLYFETALEAQQYAKEHIGTVITRDNTNEGYKVLKNT